MSIAKKPFASFAPHLFTYNSVEQGDCDQQVPSVDFGASEIKSPCVRFGDDLPTKTSRATELLKRLCQTRKPNKLHAEGEEKHQV